MIRKRVSEQCHSTKNIPGTVQWSQTLEQQKLVGHVCSGVQSRIRSCKQIISLFQEQPVDDDGTGRFTHTTSALRKNPSPMPTTHLPAMSIPILMAPASRAAPVAKTTAPNATARVRPKLSDNGPENTDATVPASRSDETTRPSNKDEISPNESVNEGIAVTGPIVPVSSPLSRPPKDTIRAAVIYLGGWRAVLSH